MRRFLALALWLLLPTNLGAGVFLDSTDKMADPFLIAHPRGYFGDGGPLVLDVCLTPGSEVLSASLTQAIDRWNALVAVTQNCTGCSTWEEPIAVGPFDDVAALVHELGHCGFGLGHTNTLLESFTASADVTAFSPGPDMIIGSSDDRPTPLPGTRIVHWFRDEVNNPVALHNDVIDDSTFSRRLLDLPTGHVWPANGNRLVSELLGEPNTQTVMYSRLAEGARYSGLTADDVDTVRFGMSGIDQIAGTNDDYTVELILQDTCSQADIEVRFTPIVPEPPIPPDEGPPARCTAQLLPITADPTGRHFRVSPVGSRLLIEVNSDLDWQGFGQVFADGFESGDTGAWTVTLATEP